MMEKPTTGDESEICQFFDGRSILITGACGYLGEILLEHLLRLCPGIAEIFILIREKRGRTPVERRHQLLNKPPFWKVNRDTPEVLKKVHVIRAQLIEDDAGISPEDLQKLKKKVSIVFHCAAAISFMRDLKYMMINNVVGTYNILSLCKKLPKLVAFVHTSTAYANCQFQVIKEEVVHIPIPVYKIIEASRSQDEVFLKNLKTCHGQKWYNKYTFSKSVAESILVREASDTPVVIVRPSIISHVWKGSLPGYIEPGTGFADLVYGIISGFSQVFLGDENAMLDTIPVDIVANTLIAAAWSVAKKKVDSPLVVNCISSNTVPLKWGHFFKEFLNRPYAAFCPNTYRTPTIVNCANSRAKYMLMSFLYHHIPAYIVDLLMELQGGEMRLKGTCKNYDKMSHSTRWFTLKEFIFESTNFDKLKSLLSKRDTEIFNTDLTGYSFQYMVEHCSVNEAWRFKTHDDELKFAQVAMAERMAMLTLCYKYFLMLLLFTLSWFLMKMIFRNLI